MQIVHIKIRNFRGILELDWAPSATVNCLIGPGDSCKTTILDAIELALGQRNYTTIEDADFYDLNVDRPIEIVVTLTNIPLEFKSDSRYGLQLRAWDRAKEKIDDEPNETFEDALSVRLFVDKSLEPRWSIYNSRIDAVDEADRPSIRYKDAQLLAVTRLGPYAERHLSWSRNSVLSRLGESSEKLSGQLADAGRDAKKAFRDKNPTVFGTVVARAQVLAKQFMVRSRNRYAAQLDIRGISISAGGISLHDGELPLRRLGTGSTRLIVSALQSETGGSNVALVDEIEHGLEPHRISRLLKYLKSGKDSPHSQLFITSHSPVVLRELQVVDIFTTSLKDGVVTVSKLCPDEGHVEYVQSQLRREPEVFLAKSVLVTEGKTEAGLLRGLDTYWADNNYDSFAFLGIVVGDGNGNSNALKFAKRLLTLGHRVLVLLDTDISAPEAMVTDVKNSGGTVYEWSDLCAVEHRVFLDLPWTGVKEAIAAAVRLIGSEDAVRAQVNNECKKARLPEISDLSLPESLDNAVFRRVLGSAANEGHWFKQIHKGEELAEIVKQYLAQVERKPLGQLLKKIRQWADG